ncbi:MAG: Ig-like domain-containing protein [Anaerolineaceae bacterium]|nr:Ig-like domain-containing protein [Anaerolineaceae bacterium]
MKKGLFFILMAVLILMTAVSSYAQDEALIPSFSGISELSLEELQDLQDQLTEAQEYVDGLIREKQREWAIENGNRVIDFDTEEFTLYTTQSKTITPTVTRIVDDAPKNTSFVWTSSDPAIARVSAGGMVTGVSLGDAEITCTASDDEYIFKTVSVHVILPVTAVSVNEQRVTLLLSDDPKAGETTLIPSISPENAFCQDVTWTSSNEAIATVDENGKVTAHAPGTSVITVFSSDPFSASYPKRAAATVTVLQAVSGIELDQPNLTMNKNAYVVLKASVLPENASQKALNWESSDPSVVRVSGGQLTALSVGTADITCTATDGSGVSAVSKVTVIQMVNNILFPNLYGSQEMLLGETRTFEPTISPEDATNKKISWSSSDSTIASVNESGKVTAKGSGRAVITCTAEDGSGKTAAVNIFIPSIGFNEKKVSVWDRSGTTIDVPFYGDPKAFEVKPTAAPNFNITPVWDSAKQVFHLKVIPIKYGSGTIYLKDTNDPQNDRSFTLMIEHSAAYDTTSFPRPRYSEAMRYPDRFEGTNISIYGKIVQKMVSGNNVALRVATSWGWDDVFYVTYKQSDIDTSIIEDDWVTIYGESTGVYTYTALFGNEITIPSMKAERIFIGNN